MLWPLLLPLKIALWSWASFVLVSTAIAPLFHWKRIPTFFMSAAFAVIAFVPSCAGIKYLVDERRFGRFQYATFNEVDDFRVERYLPTAASNITMEKYANGYRAKYDISEADFLAYLESLWGQYFALSSSKGEEFLGEGTAVSKEEMEMVFGGLGWSPLGDAKVYRSPTENDGGGATYYFDAKSGVAYQRTGYW